MYASRGLYSPEIDILTKIDRFGVEAILGRRQLYYGELKRMIIAENIVTAYRSRAARSQSWAEWVVENPMQNEILSEAELLCQS